MRVVEFRIPLPITVDEYHVCQRYTVAQSSLETTATTSDGVQCLVSEPFEDEHQGKGQFTHKRISAAGKVPGWLLSLLKKEWLTMDEKSWNAYPKLKTCYESSFIPNLQFTILSMHYPGISSESNAVGLDSSLLTQRRIIDIDIVNDPVSAKDYKVEADPCLSLAVHQRFGQLGSDWKQKCPAQMTCYKVVLLDIPLGWGVSGKVESWMISSLQNVLLLHHRRAISSMDQWASMTLNNVREFEQSVKLQLDQIWESKKGEKSAERAAVVTSSSLLSETSGPSLPEQQNQQDPPSFRSDSQNQLHSSTTTESLAPNLFDVQHWETEEQPLAPRPDDSGNKQASDDVLQKESFLVESRSAPLQAHPETTGPQTDDSLSPADSAADRASAAAEAPNDHKEEREKTHSGYLYKLGDGYLNTSWNLRYIVVQGSTLSYYRQHTDAAPRDTIDLNGAVIKYTIDEVRGRCHSIAVVPVAHLKRPTLWFSGETEEDSKLWAVRLQLASDGVYETRPDCVEESAKQPPPAYSATLQESRIATVSDTGGGPVSAVQLPRNKVAVSSTRPARPRARPPRLHTILSEMRTVARQLSAQETPGSSDIPSSIATQESTFIHIGVLQGRLPLFTRSSHRWLTPVVKSQSPHNHCPIARVERIFSLVEVSALIMIASLQHILQSTQCSLSWISQLALPFASRFSSFRTFWLLSSIVFATVVVFPYVLGYTLVFMFSSFYALFRGSLTLLVVSFVSCLAALMLSDIDPRILSALSETRLSRVSSESASQRRRSDHRPTRSPSLHLLANVHVPDVSSVHIFPWLIAPAARQVWNQQPRAQSVRCDSVHSEWISQPLFSSDWVRELSRDFSRQRSSFPVLRSWVSTLLQHSVSHKPSNWVAQRQWGIFDDGSLFVATGSFANTQPPRDADCSFSQQHKYDAAPTVAPGYTATKDPATDEQSRPLTSALRRCEALVAAEFTALDRREYPTRTTDSTSCGLDYWLVTPASGGCHITRLLAFRQQHLAPSTSVVASEMVGLSDVLAERRMLVWMKDLLALQDSIVLVSSVLRLTQELPVFRHHQPPQQENSGLTDT